MLILASASPRRSELLAAAGIRFEVAHAAIDEQPRPGEAADRLVRRLAEAKARAVHQRRSAAAVLGADTVVVVDGGVLGKPRDEEEAAAMLARLSGRDHEVLTGVALVPPVGPTMAGVERTRVWFAPLTADEIQWYVSSGEPMDKAGAYGVQGLASRFIERIDGSYSNVVGLPIALVYRLLRQHGLI